jgi:hypothetical protein
MTGFARAILEDEADRLSAGRLRPAHSKSALFMDSLLNDLLA